VLDVKQKGQQKKKTTTTVAKTIHLSTVPVRSSYHLYTIIVNCELGISYYPQSSTQPPPTDSLAGIQFQQQSVLQIHPNPNLNPNPTTMSSWSSFGKTPSGPPSSNSNSNAVPRAPTTTMTKVRPADRGEAPATEPGAVRADSGLQHHPAGQQETRVSASTGTATATAADDGNRREARRSKRAATREKMGRASVNSETILRTSAVSAAPGEARASIISRNNIEYISDDDDDDDDDDGVNGETPGSWAVAGPTVRRSQQQQAAASGKAMLKPIDDEADNLADGGATVDGGANDTNEKNLPVAFEAEVVFDYPTNNNSINNVVVAQKDDGGRVVPLKWLVIGGCFMFIAAVAISVGLGVALGGDNGDSSKDAAVVGPTDPVAPTFTPGMCAGLVSLCLLPLIMVLRLYPFIT
jgi:hypothetical protein